jgi:hypothetical protein
LPPGEPAEPSGGASGAASGAASEPASAATEAAPSEEITVWGEAVERARQAVVDQVVGLGYDKVRDRGDRTVLRHELGYKGKVVLYDDGRLAVRRTPPKGRKLDPIGGTRIRPYFLCLIDPWACVDLGSWSVSDRRWGQTEDGVVEATADPLGALGDRMADAALATRLEDIPQALDALWTRGAPLQGTDPVPTYRERRAALLAFWDSRTETVWGQAVRDAVAAFVRAEVQPGDHPFTAEEQAWFDRVRASSAPFPWTQPPIDEAVSR